VVGGGHAGAEAALASARMGRKTLLLTHSIETLGQMSCNPSIGGIGKGHLVKEVDALGGAMAIATDEAGIQFRILNSSKGPAVRATRAQADRLLYKAAIRRRLENQPNLTLFQQPVDDLAIAETGNGPTVTGVITQMGVTFEASAVVLTTGTFLSGLIHVGLEHHEAGRAGEPPAKTLGARLRELKLPVGRLKTGTPPRLDGRTIDFSQLERQPGDDPVPVMSFMGSRTMHPAQVACWITHTNERTHDIIRGGLDRSPLFTGVIKGVGPRYCPSIEDKVVRFAERKSHQIFLEPKGSRRTRSTRTASRRRCRSTCKLDLVRSIKGMRGRARAASRVFDRIRLLRSARAQGDARNEGDPRPFFRGADQRYDGLRRSRRAGLLAGINAARFVRNEAGWSPRRDEAYLGVLVDDLITRGVTEPYRMFTSRAEYRLQLREDNADLRLTGRGRDLGVIDDDRWEMFARKRDAIALEQERLKSTSVNPAIVSRAAAERVLGQPMEREYTLQELLRRPNVSYTSLMTLPGAGVHVSDPSSRSKWKWRRNTPDTSSDSRKRLRDATSRRAAHCPGSRLSNGPGPIGRSFAKARPAQAGNDRPGGTHLRNHARPLSHCCSSTLSEAWPHRIFRRKNRTRSGARRDDGRGHRRRAPCAHRRWLRGASDARPAPGSRLTLRCSRSGMQTYNLTAIREPERMVTHHVLDALAVLPHLPASGPSGGLRVLDVGSGGGVPAIPLAIAQPDWRVVALDSNHKKGAFLQQAISELPLPNAEAVIARVEDYVPTGPFDIVISRAFADLRRS
jgi:tRNA uridine 5-carboxymethylaminomethyl modification enzyme